ncbi:MAG: heme exporter protein CcmB [bacterium]
MKHYFEIIWAIINKDVIGELRSKETISSIIIFTILVFVIFNFTFEPGASYIDEIAPGILWVAYIFSSVLGLNRTFLPERENNCILGLMLSPIDRGAIYLAKMIGNMFFIFIVIGLSLPIFTVFYNINIFPFLPKLALVFFLSIAGISGLGTALSAMAVNTKTREIMLPILLFPIMVPVILASVKTTSGILTGETFAQISSWLKLMAAFDIIFITVSYLTFEYLIEE